MSSIITSMNKMKDNLEFLESLVIEIGVFEEDGSQKIKVDVLNLDDTTSEIEMTIGDIMFFTEYGTISLPSRNVFREINEVISFKLNMVISDCLSNMKNESFGRNEIISKFNVLQNEINHSCIPMAITNVLASNSTISNILDEKNDQKYLLDLNILKKYIKCKIFFKK